MNEQFQVDCFQKCFITVRFSYLFPIFIPWKMSIAFLRNMNQVKQIFLLFIFIWTRRDVYSPRTIHTSDVNLVFFFSCFSNKHPMIHEPLNIVRKYSAFTRNLLKKCQFDKIIDSVLRWWVHDFGLLKLTQFKFLSMIFFSKMISF